MTEPRTRRRPDLLTGLVLVAIALFAVLGVGGPLLGQGVFAATDELMRVAPYQGEGLDRGPVQNYYLDDTWDSGIPNTLLLAEALRGGELPAWNPYSAGGVPLGAVPGTAALSPATVPFYLLPGYLAPGYGKLVEIALAVAGCFLFLRRLGVGRPAALVGGLVFASSAFLIAWTNWPQTRVAAVAPFLFWALERLVQRRRITDGVLVAVPVAAMLLGGFPAVAGYALFVAAGYLLVRAVAEHRRHWRRAVGVLGGAAAGVLGGVALAAVQLVPFAVFLGSSYVSGRAQTPDDHLDPASLITGIAPWALGSTRDDRPPSWFLGVNMIESLSYVGAAALVLVVTAVAAPRAARAVLPRGAWVALVGATLGAVLVIYHGGAPLAVLQQLPVLFSDNFVGRLRSVLGFLVAVLAAVGLEVLLRRGRATGRARWLGLGFGAAVWLAAAALGAWVWRQARRAAVAVDEQAADGADRLAHLDGEVLAGLGFLAAGLVCAGALGWATRSGGGPGRGRRLVRTAAVGLLAVLISGQALTLVRPFWPRVDRATFYPVTPTHAFLREHLGHERYAGTWGAFGMGSDTHQRLRALTGHTFVDARFGELVRQVPGAAGLYPTHVNFGVAPEIAGSPVLDRLGTRYLVTAPQNQVLGIPRPAPSDGTIAVLHPGEPVTVPLPEPGPLRAVGITTAAPVTQAPMTAPTTPATHHQGSPPPGEPARLEVTLHRPDGSVVASHQRRAVAASELTRSTGDRQFLVPVAAEHLDPAEPLTATLTLRAGEPVAVQAAGGVPAVSTVVGAGDGLRLVHAGSAVVYERLTALPRIRWASDAVVDAVPSSRLHRLGTGELTADQVLLDAPGPGADRRPARVSVLTDGFDEIVVEVAAEGAGYLVVADALQTGWAAGVDGVPAELRAADHAVVAVAVPEGTHRVRLHYAAPLGGAGLWISGVAAVALLGLLAADLSRTRSGRPGGSPPG